MSTAAPGWYPDPAQPGTSRWWDGAAWTQHVAPAAPVAPVAPVAQPWAAQPGAAQPWGARPDVGQPWAVQQDAAPPWAAPGYGGELPAAPPAGATAPKNWLQRNNLSLVVVGLVLLYVLALAFAHITFLGVLPIVLAVRALRAREPLAVPATVLAGLSCALAVYELTGH